MSLRNDEIPIHKWNTYMTLKNLEYLASDYVHYERLATVDKFISYCKNIGYKRYIDYLKKIYGEHEMKRILKSILKSTIKKEQGR